MRNGFGTVMEIAVPLMAIRAGEFQKGGQHEESLKAKTHEHDGGGRGRGCADNAG